MLKPSEIIDEYYLDVRCKLLEIAAIFDRFDRAQQASPDPSANDDPRLQQCRAALALLNQESGTPNRAEKTALIFTEKE